MMKFLNSNIQKKILQNYTFRKRKNNSNLKDFQFEQFYEIQTNSKRNLLKFQQNETLNFVQFESISIDPSLLKLKFKQFSNINISKIEFYPTGKENMTNMSI